MILCLNAAAGSKVDSLLRLYKSATNDTVKIRLALKIGKAMLRQQNGDTAGMRYLHEAYLNSKLKHYPKLKINVCRSLGDAYNNFGDFDKTLRYYKEALSVAVSSENDEEAAVILFNMAQVYDNIRKHDEAITLMKQALPKAQKAGNKKLEGSIYNGFAAQYYQTGKSEDAVKFFYKSLSVFEELRDTVQMVNVLRNMSLVYNHMKDYDRTGVLLYRALNLSLLKKDSTLLYATYGSMGARFQDLKQFDSALVYNTKQLSYMPADVDPDSRAIAYGNLGIIYKAQKNYNKAKENYLKAMDIFSKSGSYRLVTVSHVNLGELHVLLKDGQKALFHYNEALKQTEGSKELDVMQAVHHGKYEAFLVMKDYRNALSEYEKYQKVTDSIKSSQNLSRILRLENQYELTKREKENELLKAQNLVKEAEVKAAMENERVTKLLLYGSLAVLLIIVALAFMLYKGLRENKEKNKIISEQKAIVEEKNKDITDSINYAQKIQEAILPPKELKKEMFPEGFVLFKPRDIVSGDFYWFANKNGKRIIAAVDCTGHGVPGAFMSMIGNTFLTEIVEGRGITSPAEILSEMRFQVIKALKQSGEQSESKDGMDMALLCFNENNNSVEFAGANNPLWLIRNGECISYKPDKRPVGYYRGEGLPFTNHVMECKPGDTFYIFTDGYADQFGGPDGKKLKYKPFQEILLSLQDKSMKEQEQILSKRFDEWRGSLDQVDDVLIIGIRI